jgi:hypothetical protein
MLHSYQTQYQASYGSPRFYRIQQLTIRYPRPEPLYEPRMTYRPRMIYRRRTPYRPRTIYQPTTIYQPRMIYPPEFDLPLDPEEESGFLYFLWHLLATIWCINENQLRRRAMLRGRIRGGAENGGDGGD